MTGTPRAVLVTDRGRCGPNWRLAVPALAARAAAAGVDVVQLRERGLDARALLALAADCRRALDGSRTRLLVNDRLDVALAAGADGVQLPGHGLAAVEVRPHVPTGFLIGASVRGAGVPPGARAADFLLFGTVFQSASKPGVEPAGLTGLAAAASASALPVLAIGGVGEGVLADIAGAGAAGIASIGWLAADSVAEMRRRVLAVHAAFDTLGRQLP